MQILVLSGGSVNRTIKAPEIINTKSNNELSRGITEVEDCLDDSVGNILFATAPAEKVWTYNRVFDRQTGLNLTANVSNGARSSMTKIDNDFWLVLNNSGYEFTVFGYETTSNSTPVKSLSNNRYTKNAILIKTGDGINYYRISVHKCDGDITESDYEDLKNLFSYKYSVDYTLFTTEKNLSDISVQAYYTIGSGVNATDGSNMASDKCARTGYIPISNAPFIIHNPSNEYECLVWAYSKVSNTAGTQSITSKKYVTGDVYVNNYSGDAKYFRVCVRRVDGVSLTSGEEDQNSDEYKIKNLLVVKTRDHFIQTNYDYTTLAIFPKIGVIGDSYASGAMHHPDGTGYTGNYKLSWPQIMGRLIGSLVYNFTHGGRSARTWLSDSNYGLAKLLETEQLNLYIIALGINDYTAINAGTFDLGSISDCNNDYTLNPDTFYGCYGRIIGNIKNYAPGAKIVCLSVARAAQRDMDTHIEAIANFYNVPFVNLTDDDFFHSAFYIDSITDGHPLAYSYGGMAMSIMKLIRKCIINNAQYFGTYYGLPDPDADNTES